MNVSRIMAGLGALAVLVAGAGPAAADHLVDVRSSGCTAGPFGADVYDIVRTTRVTLVDDGQGTVTATCHFTGLPARRWSEPVGQMWYRPPPGTVTPIDICVLNGPEYQDHPDHVPGYGIFSEPGATLTFTRGSHAVGTCTFVLG